VATPVVTVDGAIDAGRVDLSLTCTTGAATGAIHAQWTGTRYDGTFTFNGGASTGAVSITGWSPKTALPARRFAHGAATANVNGAPRVFVIGGGNDSSFNTAVDIYDPAADTWTAVRRRCPPRAKGSASRP
jgi:hypothetical protein